MTVQTLESRIAEVRGVMLDIDGCLIISDKPAGEHGQPLPGAVELIGAIRRSGRSLVVFTNGSQKTPEKIAEGLRSAGLDVTDEEVMTPAVVAAEVIARRHPGDLILAFGGTGVTDQFEQRGIALADHEEAFRNGPPSVAAVVIGWDTEFGRDKLRIAAEAVAAGAVVYCTSDAPSFASASRLNVGVSGFIASGLAHVTGQPYRTLGKPSPEAMEAIEMRLGVAAEEMVVLGDDLVLECSMAKRHGALAGLVTTGTHSAQDALAAGPDRSPDFVIDSLHEIIGSFQDAPMLSGKKGF
ncbi:HAD-IIA family hydrolase [Nesterenkonia sp. DZ6]|uniref:HAD-IIA family hydrolase n=1 Tax=Nesterenkonia sp. DZ6 TaxID=2901229 RepID=UPI001F4D311E|nr:HAD family hydrolase [Nesterenkonia sp. DZ6]MCH8560330.1 HAD hydrolase-like protein [Nesterenkonia sp. DZ6]